MFAYNPTPDRSAEILSRANENAAAIQMRSMENLGNSLAAMGESAAKAYSEASENKMTSDYLDAMAGHFNATPRPDGSGRPYMSDEQLKEFSKAPLGRKSGSIAALQAQQDYDMKRWMYQKQYDNYMSRIGVQAANQAAARQPAANQQPVAVPQSNWMNLVPPRNP